MVCDKFTVSNKRPERSVLILILLEYGLRPTYEEAITKLDTVLILILLEYGLRLNETLTVEQFKAGLNPYSIGIWSATTSTSHPTTCSGLNPYSIGIWSATHNEGEQRKNTNGVLILILLEYGLRPFCSHWIQFC